MPRRPARPVSWVYSPGVTSTCASPFHLTSRSRTTGRAGMLMPSARVSVAKTALTRPRTKHSSTVSLNAGTSPAWWAASPASSPSRHPPKPRTRRASSGGVAGHPGEQPPAPLPEAEDVQVLVGQRAGALVDDPGDLGALGLVGEPQPRLQALRAAGGRGADRGDPAALGLVGEPQPRLRALRAGGVAAVAAEDEGDRRQQAGAV